MIRTATLLLFAGLSAAAAADALHAGRAQPIVAARDLLREIGAWSATDLSAIERGEAVARIIDTDRRQVAVAGAVRIRAGREAIVARQGDLGHLARSHVVLQVGVFSATPRPDDVANLAFEPYDLDSVGKCEPGDCPVRLSKPMAAKFQQHVNWSAPDRRDQVARLWRQALAEYATEYRARGAESLPEYHNKRDLVRVRDEFDVLFAESAPLVRVAPLFIGYLRDYPRTALAGTSDLLYWSKEDFGVRPVVSLTHLITYLPPGSRNAFVATKQIYATHYFDAGLGLTLVLDDGADGCYLVSVNRVRTRSLTSFFRGFVRTTVQTRSRDKLEKMLRSARDSLGR